MNIAELYDPLSIIYTNLSNYELKRLSCTAHFFHDSVQQAINERQAEHIQKIIAIREELLQFIDCKQWFDKGIQVQALIDNSSMVGVKFLCRDLGIQVNLDDDTDDDAEITNLWAGMSREGRLVREIIKQLLCDSRALEICEKWHPQALAIWKNYIIRFSFKTVCDYNGQHPSLCKLQVSVGAWPSTRE